MKGETKGDKPTKVEVIANSLQKTKYLLIKSAINDKEVYECYKYFFSNYYELDYEFSAQELLLELDKVYVEENVRKYYDYIINKVASIEFKDNSLNDEELFEVLKVLKTVMVYLKKIKPEKKEGLLSKIFGVFRKKNN